MWMVHLFTKMLPCVKDAPLNPYSCKDGWKVYTPTPAYAIPLVITVTILILLLVIVIFGLHFYKQDKDDGYEALE